jgi:hypothetical protein
VNRARIKTTTAIPATALMTPRIRRFGTAPCSHRPPKRHSDNCRKQAITLIEDRERQLALLGRRQQAEKPVLAVVVAESNMASVGDEQTLLSIFKFHGGFDRPPCPFVPDDATGGLIQEAALPNFAH